MFSWFSIEPTPEGYFYCISKYQIICNKIPINRFIAYYKIKIYAIRCINMHRFDYSFLKGSSFSADIVSYASRIESMRERGSFVIRDHPSVMADMEAAAKVMSIRESNAIEGIVTSDDRIMGLATGSTSPRGHTEAEIAGYRDVLNIVHTRHDSLNIDENTILRMFSVMGEHSDGPTGYKTRDNAIVDVHGDGTRSMRFRPVSAAETPMAMEQLVLAYLEARDDMGINNLLLIPCFILDFLCIHPFIDGNGRMSRLLTLLLLYQEGYDVGKYISVEARISATRDRYYEALSASSKGWHENESDYMPFISYMLGVLMMCYREFDSRFRAVEGSRMGQMDRVREMVMNSVLPVSKSDLSSMMPDVSVTTIEAVLGEMVREGIIRKIGGNRNARYIRASDEVWP